MKTEFNNTYANYFDLAVGIDRDTRSFRCFREGRGVIAENISLSFESETGEKLFDALSFGKAEFFWEQPPHIPQTKITERLTEGGDGLPAVLDVVYTVTREGIYCEVVGLPEGIVPVFRGALHYGDGDDSMAVCLDRDKAQDDFRSAYGPAVSKIDDSIFDRRTDSAVTVSGSVSHRLCYSWADGCYGFTVKGKLSLTFTDRVYERKFRTRYKPINKQNTFPKPPAGWMTWYAVMFGACEEKVIANAEWQKKYLADYGADTVWVDWEWYHKDFGDYNGDFDSFTPDAGKYPHGMKYVSDRIKEDGFVPCIWIGASHDVRENRFLKEHPESLLVKRPSWCGDYWFDPTNPDYLNSFIPEVFSQLTEKWGYGAIKWDALPRALDYFDQYHDRFFDTSVTSEQAMRNVVKKARETVGDRVYMLSCHGEGERDIMLYSDVFDAARIGADIFSWDNFIESGVRRLLGFYFLHNIAEYCDPDNLVVREEFNTCDQAVSRASLFSLLGTPITLGDDLRELSDGRIGIIRRAIPPMNTHPMIPDRCALPDECLVVGCFVRTRSDEYQIADIFNMRERPVTYRLDFSGLDLEPEAEYLVYDFWNRRFLGKLRHGVTVSLPACGSAVLSVRRVTGIPQLVATSRHITQGAFDVLYCGWDPDTRTFSGRSRTVPGDEYTVTVYDPLADSTAEVTLTPDGTETDWSITL
ncbi:MAG: hypothetical protein BHW37_05035 [Firmicutes bacterium CAG:272_52_7]|nr:MAG: hypothetical protein BHW37_05035 [Firmicutes bacterium CAG:272_52_7]